MSAMRTLLSRLRGLFGGSRRDRDLRAEIDAHIAEATDDFTRQGKSPDEARRAALARFGGVTQAMEAHRERRGFTVVWTVWQDLRYAARALLHSKMFAFSALVSLAIGIGANTAMFAVVRAVVLEPLPYPAADRLVTVSTPATALFSAPAYLTLQREQRELDAIGAFETSAFVLAGDGPVVQVAGQRVSAEIVSMLGLDGSLRPVRGRSFQAAEFEPNGPPVALISDRLWRTRFNRDAGTIGRTLRVDGEPYTVIGITSPRFTLFPESDLLLPLSLTVAQRTDELYRRFELLGLLKPGAGSQPASTTIALTPLRDRVIVHADRTLFTLWGATGFVFVIGCLNFSNLLLARSVNRRHEMALRAALGARPIRLIRLVVAEAALLALAGGAVGIVLAYGGVHVLLTLEPNVVPRANEIEFDTSIAVFAEALGLLAGVLFGSLPAVKLASPRLNECLRDAGGTREPGIARFRYQRGRGLLALTQIAATLSLLIGAGLLAKSFWRISQVTAGYEPARLIALQFELPASKYNDDSMLLAFARDLGARIRGLPGVKYAGATSNVPLLPGRVTFRNISIDGRTTPIPTVAGDVPIGLVAPPPPPPRPGSPMSAFVTQPRLLVFQSQIDPDFLDAMGIPQIAGRRFGSTDDERADRVAIVNETMAKRLWPDGSALGHRIRSGPFDTWATIVGVVGDVRRFSRDDSVRPEVFVPLAQQVSQLKPDRPLSPQMRPAIGLSFAIRMEGAAELSAEGVRQALAPIDPNLAIARLSTMQSVLHEAVASRTFVLMAFVAFAGLALVLAAVGVYGLMSYLVRQRMREFGVRVALGAGRREVLWAAVSDGITLAAGGIGIGLMIAHVGSGVLRTWLHDVAPTDPPTYIALSLAMAAVVGAASYLPARQAARVNPIDTLRQE
jgi:putative ABC transport system permease protein